jgi:hypothetical protein
VHASISEPILGLVRFQAPVVVTERPTRTPVVNGTERPTRVPIVATERPTRVLPRPVLPSMLRRRRLGHLSGLHPAGRPRACCPALLAPFAVLSQVPVVVTERPTRGQQTRPPRAAATTVARAAATTAAMNAPPSRRAVGSRQPAAANSGSASKAGVPLETLLGASSANSAAKAAAAAQTRAGAPAATRTQAAAADAGKSGSGSGKPAAGKSGSGSGKPAYAGKSGSGSTVERTLAAPATRPAQAATPAMAARASGSGSGNGSGSSRGSGSGRT